jgi:hypothetical protein
VGSRFSTCGFGEYLRTEGEQQVESTVWEAGHSD